MSVRDSVYARWTAGVAALPPQLQQQRSLVALSASTVAVAALFVRSLLRRAAAVRQAAEAARLAEIDRRTRDRFPIMSRIEGHVVAAAKTAKATQSLVSGVHQIAMVLASAGDELKRTLPASLDDEDHASMSDVSEYFQAWKDVGNANERCAEFLRGIGAAAQRTEVQAAEGRERHLAEAHDLWQTLVLAEGTEPVAATTGRWLTRLLYSAKPTQQDLQIHEERLEGQRSLIGVRLETIRKATEAAEKSCSDRLGRLLQEARQPTQLISEQLATLRRTGLVDNPSPRRVGGLVQSLSTPEGRRRHLEAEEASAAKVATDGLQSQMTAVQIAEMPAAELVGDREWRVRGMYEHQVLKVGLRILDERWLVEGLTGFPRTKEGGAVLFRERLLKELISGTVNLQSVQSSDIVAAQRDIQSLSSRQLLRLRVLHLDYIPSGSGADTITSVGGPQEAFLSAVDGRLFRLIGEIAAGSNFDVDDCDAHRLGREAVFFVAVASVVRGSPWWSWWISPERRIFSMPIALQVPRIFLMTHLASWT